MATQTINANLDVLGEVQGTSLDINGAADISGDVVGGANAIFTGDLTVTGTDIRTGASNGLDLGDDSSIITLGRTNEMWTQQDVDADATLYVNYRGYNAASTRFRSFDIRDGKAGQIALFNGTDKSTTFGGTLTIPSDIIHSGDTNNKIAFGTDTQAFETGGSTRMNVSDSGFQVGASGARVTTIENNDSLGTSDTKLCTQGNVKAYVDSAVSSAGGGDVTLSGTQTFTGVKTFGTTTKLQFRDSAAYINSPTANDIEVAATTITLDASSDIQLEGNTTVTGSITADQINLQDGGDYITFYGNNAGQHSISSRDASGTAGADDLRINSYGAVYINLDSNSNNGDTANFEIGHHGDNDGTITNLFTVNGENGNVTLTGIVLDGNTITGIDNASEFTDNDAHIMTSTAIKNKIADNDNSFLTSVPNHSGNLITSGTVAAARVATLNQNTTGSSASCTGNAATATKISSITNSNIVQLTASQTLTNKTIAASQITEISNITASEGAQLENIGSTTISATQWGYLGAATGAITNTDTNTQLSTEQVQDIVGGMLVGTETRIGVSYDDTNGRINFVVDDMTANTNTQLSNAEVRAAVAAATDSQVFTDADHTKLNGIATNATADQTNVSGSSGSCTGNAATATKISSITNSNIVQLSTTTTQTGTKTFSGVVDITNTTDSTNATGDTGALRTEGGASIAKKLYVGSTITGSADVIAFSDRKLKKNIETLDGKKVLDMRGVSFTRKDTGAESSGVIAQEIQKVAPELVHDTEGTLGVAYGNLVGYLIEAVKDQQKQIDELKKLCNGCSR